MEVDVPKPAVPPRRRAFMGGSTSSNVSAEAPVVQVEMAVVHDSRPVPMPRTSVQEIVDLTSMESEDTDKEIFFAESRKNTIIQPEIENPKAKLDSIASGRESSVASSGFTEVRDVSGEATPVSAISDSSSSKRRKKKTKKRSRDQYIELEDIDSRPKLEEKKDAFSYEYIIGIYLHHLVKLKAKLGKNSQNPRVKVSWFDMDTEKLLRKSDPNRNVSLHGEPDDLDFIQPLISKESRVQKAPKSKYISCEWEELLIFNEDIERVKNGRVVIFLELLDIRKNGFEGICWAFLKPFLADMYNNIDKRSELQFFEYYRSRKEVLGIFDQWKKPRKKFPATIVVTLKGVKPVAMESETMRPMNVLEREKQQEFKESFERSSEDATVNPVEEVRMQRRKLPGQQCKCPNQLVKRIQGGQKGSFLAKFHPEGSILLYTSVDQNKVDVILAEIPTLETISCLAGHTSSVYDVDFRTFDENANRKDLYPMIILTASADKTAAIWNVNQHGYSLKTLPHPSFVYCCRFIRINEDREIILTGCRDCVIRLWDFNDPEDCTYSDELTKHEGFVTAFCAGKAQGSFFSGDSEGAVLEWQWKRDYFEPLRFLTINPIDREMIHGLTLHTRGEKLLVGTSANAIYCVDMKAKVVLRSFRKSSLEECRSAFRFALTSCGNLLFGCSDHEIACWNTITGDDVEINLDFSLAPSCFISCLDFHPHDSMIVLGIYGNDGGVFLLDYVAKDESSSKVPIKMRFKQIGTDLRRKIEVKNKLTEIIRKIDDVFLISKNSARLSDDDKLLERKLTRNREEITEWLNNVVSARIPSSLSRSSTYTIHKDSEGSADESGATFTVEAPPPKPPRSRIPIRRKEKPKEDNEANLTFEIAVKSDPESDDTTISEELH
ncbi:jouberin-like [Phlebotomus argentipes]|uniref:jouberin-like n=1 Tax=Phlebotomus argentipes TaxID=94469 RepID=UPI0028937AA4|nr:jouberin-like [Phlebotomus argentipes]